MRFKWDDLYHSSPVVWKVTAFFLEDLKSRKEDIGIRLRMGRRNRHSNRKKDPSATD